MTPKQTMQVEVQNVEPHDGPEKVDERVQSGRERSAVPGAGRRATVLRPSLARFPRMDHPEDRTIAADSRAATA